MIRIGILAGRDRVFTDAVLSRLNSGDAPVGAYMTLTGTSVAGRPPNTVILDRISHRVPFYQSYLSAAALKGVHVVNDPFWQLAEDKFLDVCVARTLGVTIPRTVLLPNYGPLEGVVAGDLGHFAEPVDWEAAMAWVGFPMVMRPHDGAESRKAYLLNTPEELQARWQRSGPGQVILQEWLGGATYLHCLVIGDEALPIIRPLRQAPQDAAPPLDSPGLARDVAHAAVAISKAFGYQMNAVELAVLGGDLYVTDWLNHCPPVEPRGLTEAEFDWVVSRTAHLLLHLAQTPKGPSYRWDPWLGAEG